MSRPAFVVTALILMLFGSAWFSSWEQAQQRQSASYAARQEAHERQQPVFRPSEPTADAEPVAEQPKWWERKDLEAQQSVARWTRRMGVLTTIGIVLLAWTLWETRRTVGEARAATKAARDTLASDRAWLTPSGEKAMRYEGPDRNEEPTTGGLKYATVWTNSGRSPALDVRVFIAVAVRSKSDSLIRFAPPPKVATPWALSDLEPTSLSGTLC